MAELNDRPTTSAPLPRAAAAASRSAAHRAADDLAGVELDPAGPGLAQREGPVAGAVRAPLRIEGDRLGAGRPDVQPEDDRDAHVSRARP